MSASVIPKSAGRSAHAGVLALTVLVFGAAVAAVTWQLRAGLREQIVRREAGWLEAIVSMQLADAAETLGGEPLEQVPLALLVAVLRTQKLAGVSGLRVYGRDGRLSDTWMLSRSAPPASPAFWSRLAAGEAIGTLHTRISTGVSENFFFIPASGAMMEAWVPLRLHRTSPLIGAVQFWTEGGDLVTELGAHDRRIWMQAAIAWLVGSLVIATVMGWALRRLNEANRQLRARSEDLQRANRELVLAAKTSALGAVTAHLMHELKNPLAGLEVIVAGQGDLGGRSEFGSGGELAAATELTRRLRTMVNDVVGVLRDEQTGAEFELTCAEIAELVIAKVQAEAQRRAVKLNADATPDVSVSGRRANLVTLVLRNLLQNALEATPQGGTVSLTGRGISGGGIEFLIEDNGAGLPAPVRGWLFQPCASTKAGGSGLGLALSYQLAQQAGGRLELVRTDQSGTTFRLVLGPEA
ncbi:MAG: sensor histidine kinase [Opitutaceae bacterium]